MALPQTYTIAITGGQGLLASGFIRHALSLGHRVVALDRNPPSFSLPSQYPPSPPHSINGDVDEDDTPPSPWVDKSDPNAFDRSLMYAAISQYPAQYEYKQVDLLDYSAFKKAVEGCDALVHLAAVYRKHDGYGNYLEGGLAEHVS
jgi:nucleoside-diphosphate-sugar epimerase